MLYPIIGKETGFKGVKNYQGYFPAQSLSVLNATLPPLEYAPSVHLPASFRELKEHINSDLTVWSGGEGLH